MKDLEKQIVTWHEELLPNINEQAMLDEIQEECKEVYTCAEYIGYHRQYIAHELADIAIVAINYLARFHNKTLEQVIAEKFEIVKDRKYEVEEDEDGNRERIR